VLTLRGPTDSSLALRSTGAQPLNQGHYKHQPNHCNEQLFDHGGDAPSGGSYLQLPRLEASIRSDVERQFGDRTV
jgi:hypothetical protein